MLHDIIDTLCYSLFGINVVLFTFCCKAKPSQSLLWLKRYLWLMVPVNLAVHLLSKLNIHNLFMSHVYFTVQFITVSLLYKNLFNHVLLRKIVTYVTPSILIAEVINYSILPHKFFEFNILEVYLCSVPLAAYAVIYLFRSIDGKNKKWIYFSGGLMLYLLSSSLVFSGADVILQKYISKMGFINFWMLNNIVYIIYQLLLSFDWYENFRKPVTSKNIAS